MLRDAPFLIGETYHVYNRGAHKQAIFTNEEDYQRFLLLLYLANSEQKIDMRSMLSKYKGRSFVTIFEEELSSHSLVDLYSYSLMPNHFHLVLRQKAEGGISAFLKKVLTGYSMYFNTKYEHSGVLFQGRFKSKHIDTESYFRYIFAYVHLNSLDLFEPGWGEKGIHNIEKSRQFVNSYPFSSFVDYAGIKRPERAVIAFENAPSFLTTQNDLEELLATFTKDRPLYVGGDKEATDTDAVIQSRG